MGTLGTLTRIAARNVFRNKWRSAISLIAIFLGVGMVTAVQGLLNGFLRYTVEDTTLAKLGAIQVHKVGFLDAEKDPLKLDMPADAASLAKVAAVPGVKAVTPRITFEGMLSNGNVSSMFQATAIDPRSEYKVCPKRSEAVTAGAKPLDEKRPSDVLVGQALVDSVDAKPGASLTIMAASKAGPSNALDVTVSGILPARMVVESKRMSTVPLALAQELLRMPNRATEYAVAVDNLDAIDGTVARIRAALGPGYDVQSWRDLSLLARDSMMRLKIILIVVTTILFLLVLSGVVNTMLMSVYERIREIGTMLAVGMKRRQVLLLFLLEASILGGSGALAGAAAGTGVVAYMASGKGLSIKQPGTGPVVCFPYLTTQFMVLVVAGAIVGALIAALYPAWKGARLRPVDALRSV